MTARLRESQPERQEGKEKEEESASYTGVSQQTLDPIHCPSKFNRISHVFAQGAEVHHSRVREREREGGVERLWERIRELANEKESERARKKKSERQRERKSLRERPTTARRRGREKERERESY